MPRTKKKPVVDAIIEHANSKEDSIEESAYTLIPTGSTMLDLACSDTSTGGVPLGTIVNFVGYTFAGKTLLALTILAELCMLEQFDDYRLIFDDVEAGNKFDVMKLFGNKLASRIEAPTYDEEGNELSSDTVEEFRYNIDTALKGEPFIYVLDSFDGLTSEMEIKKEKEINAKMAKGEDTSKLKGSYGAEKAKSNSLLFRLIKSKLKKHNSVLVVVSQVRDNFNNPFDPITRAGGKALDHYSAIIAWLKPCSVPGISSTKYKKHDRIIGVQCQVTVKKNKMTGKVRQVDFPIYYSYGIDDIGSCIDFLLKEKVWSKPGTKVNATHFRTIATRKKLIEKIEEKPSYHAKLKMLVERQWIKIEDSIKMDRRKKYE